MARKNSKPTPRKGSSNQLRIIGGQWRSRRLPIARVQGLRPTPDRVRETLFNWLQMAMPGARCLDLFAGSGALGFEALSREAGDVVLVEKHPAAFAQLRDNAATLSADDAGTVTLVNDDALRYLQREEQPFDVIFLDPPFRKGLLTNVLDILVERELLKPSGKLYLEYEQEYALDLAQWNLEVQRETSAGQVRSLLTQSAN